MTDATRRFQARLHRDFEMNAERHRLAGAQFAAAYWDHLRGLGPAPLASAHELSESVADVIRNQCDNEHRFKR